MRIISIRLSYSHFLQLVPAHFYQKRDGLDLPRVNENSIILLTSERVN